MSYSNLTTSSLCWSMNVPPLQTLIGLHSQRSAARSPPLHSLSPGNKTQVLLHVTVKRSLGAFAAQSRRLLSHFAHRQLPMLLNHCREEWLHGLQVMSNVALAGLCPCTSDHIMPKSTSSNRVGAKEVYHAWGRYRALRLVKETGLEGSNVLGHGMECPVWASPYPEVKWSALQWFPFCPHKEGKSINILPMKTVTGYGYTHVGSAVFVRTYILLSVFYILLYCSIVAHPNRNPQFIPFC